MKILLCLASPDPHLRRMFGRSKGNAVPQDAGRRGYFQNRPATFVTTAWEPEEQPTADSFERYLIGKTKSIDATLLIIDASWVQIAKNVRDAVFIIPITSASAASNYQNFTQKTVAKSLRAFGQLLAKFERADDGKLLTLPLRNFDAPELRELARLCREENLDPDFSELVEAQLAGLRRRERPRRRSTYRTVYAVDDRQRFFQYGHERHARFPTGEPHRPYCEISGTFRFGKRIDEQRHYNVSETEGDITSISGDFWDCHERDPHEIKGRYLNMFANSYFTKQ